MSAKTQNLAGTLTALSQEIGIKPLAKIVATGRFLPSVFLNSTNSTKILTKKITMPPKYITHNWSTILCALAFMLLSIVFCFFRSPLWAIPALLLLRTFYIADLGVFVDPANDRISFAGSEATLKPRDVLAPFKRKEIRLSQVTSVKTEKRGAAYLNRANAVCLSGAFGEAKIFCDSEAAAKALAAAVESEIKK